jgi:hypothetical protein
MGAAGRVFDGRATLGFCTLSMKRSAPEGPTPTVSFDGRSAKSKWGHAGGKLVKMCPHIKPGGGQCGLDAEHCFCLCLLCSAPMKARKRCGALMKDGSRCMWGSDRSPEVSSPEQDHPLEPRPRQPTLATCGSLTIAAAAVAAGANSSPPTKPVSPAAAAFLDESLGGGRCLPNLEPGGPCGIPTPPPRRSKVKEKQQTPRELFLLTPDSSPVKSHDVATQTTRPQTVWNRTLFAVQKRTSPTISNSK